MLILFILFIVFKHVFFFIKWHKPNAEINQADYVCDVFLYKL